MVSADESEDVIRFTVRDEGVGISREHLPHVFERFYRGAKPRGGVAGTGLGLYVSKSLVEQMGGRIWVDSVIGEGSRFSFELPMAGAGLEATEKIAS
jgi:histidine kinase